MDGTVVLGTAPVVALHVRTGHGTHLEHAAVHGPRRPGDVARLRRGQERDDGGDLPGVAGTPQRDAGPLVTRAGRVLVLLTGHGGGDLAGGDGVDGDAVLGELDRRRPGEQSEAALGRAVRRGPHPRLVLVHAGDVDDPPAAAG